MSADHRGIAISASFTAETLQPALAFWAGELGLDHEIRFAPYSTMFQQLLDPSGLFASNRGGVNVALLRLEDWMAAGPEEQVCRFAEAVRSAMASTAAPLIVVICPPSPRHAAALAGPHEKLAALLSDLGVHLITTSGIEALYPVDEVHDPHGDQLGHLPYTPVFFVALATALARKIHAIVMPPFKVAALDCDDTLWSGICGEDGPQGIALDPPRIALQRFLAARRREGLLLALCSKNNEDDVLEAFRAHPEMPLSLDDFASRRVNWESKATNLAGIAADLDLGLDSFVLIDDNPKECAEVQTAQPEVLALSLPEETGDIPEFLKHVWAFDRARVTDEDRRRPEMYAQRAERARAAATAASLEEFVASLQLQIRIAPMEPSQLPRVSQLTQRTNQMNATLVRRTEAEVQALLASGFECQTVDVSDRFGSYGLTGLLIYSASGKTLLVDTLLLSCRALGRGVEHRMIARLGEIALQKRLDTVEIPFRAGQRNKPAALLLESLAPAAATASDSAETVFRFTAAEAAAVRFKIARPGSNGSHPPAPVPAERPLRKRIDYARIATELRSPYAVLERIRSANKRAQSPRAASFDPPRTPLERDLAELWAGLLNVSAVGINDNFFELGGHSLLAVQLLSRVRQIYNLDLSLEVVYTGDFTVAELAKAVELKEIERSDGEYQDLLKELEGLSDEEVRELLAKEQDAP
jgi:FkbH-like protein